MGKAKVVEQTSYAVRKKKSFLTKIIEQRELVLITLPFFILLVTFSYVPLWGWIMAFKDFKPHLGILNSPWYGLKNFKEIFNDPMFYLSIRNTLGMSLLKYVTGFIATITLAVMINEVRKVKYKKLVQAITYLPHFVSWVVVASLVYNMLSTDGGIINEILMKLHLVKEPITFMGRTDMFWGIVAAADIWKEVGWGTIIYLAAMTSIDSQLYEAAHIDGAGRIKQIFAITLPSIVNVIKIIMILQAGWLFGSNFEQIFLLQNYTLYDVSRTVDIYVYQFGLGQGKFSFATAAGIFSSLVALILVTVFNKLSSALDGEKAF